MITEARIQKDIARIETLMMLGSKREKALLATIRHDCFRCLNLIDQLGEEVYEKQHELATTMLQKYDLAMEAIRKSWLKNEIIESIKKELESEVLKQYKPDKLRHQIRFLNYLLGNAEIIPQNLLTSMKAVSQTEHHGSKQKRSAQ